MYLSRLAILGGLDQQEKDTGDPDVTSSCSVLRTATDGCTGQTGDQAGTAMVLITNTRKSTRSVSRGGWPSARPPHRIGLE